MVICLVINLFHCSGFINAINVSPDGKTVITGSEDKTIKVFDLESRAVVNTFKVPGAYFFVFQIVIVFLKRASECCNLQKTQSPLRMELMKG